MTKGTKVSWITASNESGTGITITDSDENGQVMVAKDKAAGEEHPVIWCATTWLTEIV